MNGFIENQIVVRRSSVGADAEVGLFKMNAVDALQLADAESVLHLLLALVAGKFAAVGSVVIHAVGSVRILTVYAFPARIEEYVVEAAGRTLPGRIVQKHALALLGMMQKPFCGGFLGVDQKIVKKTFSSFFYVQHSNLFLYIKLYVKHQTAGVSLAAACCSL